MKRNRVVAIGNFDGFHLGHKEIIKELYRLRDRQGYEPMLVTFDPNPKVFFGIEERLILTLKQKKAFLIEMGLCDSTFFDFHQVSRMSGRDFVEKKLIGELGMVHVIVGYNFKFGKNREWDIESLKKLSKELGFGLTVISPILLNSERVSSTLIRKKISEGQVSEAAKLLGHYFYIDGIIVRGSGRGHKIGYPTVNISTENQLFPLGVFQTELRIENERYDSITNIGVNPTFYCLENGNGSRLETKIETHIFSFDRSVYGSNVRVFFKKKIRDEKKFDSENDLVAQIKADIRQITVDK